MDADEVIAHEVERLCVVCFSTFLSTALVSPLKRRITIGRRIQPQAQFDCHINFAIA